MTREEAIERIKNHKIIHKMNEPRAIYISEALDIAIKALEQEPCKDAVSRQVVKEQMNKYGFHAPDMTVTEFVEDLPPVIPQPEIGKWKREEFPNAIFTVAWFCNKCGRGMYCKTNYCPNCGAKMEGEE